MDFDFVPIVLFLSLAWVIVAVTRAISDTLVRRRLIEAGASAEMAEAINSRQRDPGLYGALKWGLVIAALGLALILTQFLPYGKNDPITFGLVLLFGAGGLLLYYAIVRQSVAKEERRFRERSAPVA